MTEIKITPEMKITPVADKEIPVREGTAKYERVMAVLKSKRVELALKKGARASTVRFCVERGLVKVAA